MQKILSVEIVKTRCAHLFDENELIKNRFDHQNKKYFWVRVVVDHGVYWVPAWRKYFKVNLGVYLQSYPFDVAELIKKLFRKMWWVSKISVSHLINPVPGLVYSNNFIIQLPLTQDIYDSFLSKKLLSNIRYGYKNLVDKYEVSFCSCQDIPVEYVQQYLDWKSLSHDFSYSKPAKQFLSDYSINYCYYLLSKKSGSVIAILFTHQNGHNSFFENFAYDSDYSKYSPGKVLLYLVIRSHISQGIKSFVMGGGSNNSYKSDFCTEVLRTYSGKLSRADLI